MSEKKPIVALMTRHHSTLICQEARQLLLDAGFEIRSNDTGRILTRQEQKELIRDAFAIIAGTEKYDADMLSGCRELRAMLRFGVGTDSFDLPTLKEMGVQVGVIANHDSVAEFALLLILAAMKNYPRLDAAVRQGKWSRFPMRELTGKTVGLVGFGRSGRRLAELLRGFRVELLAYDPYMNEAAAAERKVTPVTMDELLQRSDVISLHLPSTPETFHLIGREALEKMKDGAYLINTARGGLVNDADLREALLSGKVYAAAADVVTVEPIRAVSPLVGLDIMFLTPHIAWACYETRQRLMDIAVDNVRQYLAGTPVNNVAV